MIAQQIAALHKHQLAPVPSASARYMGSGPGCVVPGTHQVALAHRTAAPRPGRDGQTVAEKDDPVGTPRSSAVGTAPLPAAGTARSSAVWLPAAGKAARKERRAAGAP